MGGLLLQAFITLRAKIQGKFHLFQGRNMITPSKRRLRIGRIQGSALQPGKGLCPLQTQNFQRLRTLFCAEQPFAPLKAQITRAFRRAAISEGAPAASFSS